MEYNVIKNSFMSDEIETFIGQCVEVFDDLKLDSKGGSLFMIILSDIAMTNKTAFESTMHEINSYKKMETFVSDLWDKFNHNEEIFGIKYKILTKNSVGYRAAYDAITPDGASFTPRGSDNLNTNVLNFERPVAELNGKIIVASR